VSILSEEGKLARYFESITFAQIEPHSTQRKGRSCKDCHQNPKVVGLGYGEGLDRLSRVGDREGRSLVKFNREGLRPFTKEELDRILKVGLCLSCHEERDRIFKNWRSDLKCPRLRTLA
jgi:hypothetical protein